MRELPTEIDNSNADDDACSEEGEGGTASASGRKGRSGGKLNNPSCFSFVCFIILLLLLLLLLPFGLEVVAVVVLAAIYGSVLLAAFRIIIRQATLEE